MRYQSTSVCLNFHPSWQERGRGLALVSTTCTEKARDTKNQLSTRMKRQKSIRILFQRPVLHHAQQPEARGSTVLFPNFLDNLGTRPYVLHNLATRARPTRLQFATSAYYGLP